MHSAFDVFVLSFFRMNIMLMFSYAFLSNTEQVMFACLLLGLGHHDGTHINECIL